MNIQSNAKTFDFGPTINGELARSTGAPLAANPYPARSREAAAWATGWLAEDDYRDDAGE